MRRPGVATAGDQRASRRAIGLGLTIAATLLLAACGSNSSASPAASTGARPTVSASGSAVSGSAAVFAAASLTGTFTQLGKQFEAANPGSKITFSFAASSALALQINSGAPADVFASASPVNMAQVTATGEAKDPVTFATNDMMIAVPPSNPAHVTSVQDLAKSSVMVALCQPQVPCGATAAKVFTNAGITVTPVTLEPDVKSVLSKVALDSVDAGVVYVTDVKAAGSSVQGVSIPDDVNATTSYPIATTSHGSANATAEAFMAYVLSPAGQAVFSAAGFGGP
jgi:molybdate transport system substrate-binding protein